MATRKEPAKQAGKRYTLDKLRTYRLYLEHAPQTTDKGYITSS